MTQPVDQTSIDQISIQNGSRAISAGKRRGWNHTNLRCVVGGTEDQLRSSVVARADVGNVGLILDENFGGTEITELQNTGV